MSDAELKRIIMSFRVSDLVVLLGFAGRNKCGKKSELQKRALDLIKFNSSPVEMKIRELQDLRSNRVSDQQNIPERSEPRGLPLADINQPSTSSNSSNSGSCSSSKSSKASVSGSRTLRENFPISKEKKNVSKVPSQAMLPPYAVNPDVKFKELPFFDNLGEVLKPSTLMPLHGQSFQESDFFFHFTPHQVHELTTDEDIRVQLRFGLLETTCEQDDNFPDSICVKVNKRMAMLPNPVPTTKQGTDPKRPSRPVDITSICRFSPTAPNDVHVSWASSYERTHVAAVFLVRRLTSTILINRLKDNKIRNADHTTAMIKEKLCQDRNSEIAMMSLRGSLTCPLGKIKMILPCRSLTCSHLQCFDAQLYIQMNERKPKWICPVCDKPALYQHLAIDGLFLDIATKLSNDVTEVQFYENGSWTPVKCTAKVEDVNDSIIGVEVIKEVPKMKQEPVEVVNIESDSDTEDSWSMPEFLAMSPPAKRHCKGIPPPFSYKSRPAASMSATFIDRNSGNLKISESVTMPDKRYEPSTSSGIIHNNTVPKSESSTTNKDRQMNLDVLQSASPETILPDFPENSEEDMSPSICAPATALYAELSNAIVGPENLNTLDEVDLVSLIQQSANETIAYGPSDEVAASSDQGAAGPDGSSDDKNSDVLSTE